MLENNKEVSKFNGIVIESPRICLDDQGMYVAYVVVKTETLVPMSLVYTTKIVTIRITSKEAMLIENYLNVGDEIRISGKIVKDRLDKLYCHVSGYKILSASNKSAKKYLGA